QPIRQALWKLWATAPDAAAQALLDRGMSARGSYDFLGAIEAFDRLVEYCPDYAEGYNQRAFVNFLREDFEPALTDLDLALARNPNHVAALSGKALTLMGLGRGDEAQEVLREAIKLNPWIPERGLLTEPLGEEL
ncbi:MAG: tetratricopeptide repeat protein, partial [Paracoccaceae bacterium]